MLKISSAYAGCPGLSPAISAQFTLEMCAEAPNAQKTLKFHIVQDLRSLKVIDVDIIQKLVTSASYDKQHVCAYLQLFFPSRANSFIHSFILFFRKS